MTRNIRRALAAACLTLAGAFALPASSSAMQSLDAVDHAELAAEISATEVNRIALTGDRISRVVRAPDGYAVEHDAGSGDLYLRRMAPGPAAVPEGPVPSIAPVTLFIGTEKGFTYRLTLTPSAREPAQILIRNADALPDMARGADGVLPAASEPHVAVLVRLVRAVVRREPLPGYTIHADRDRRLAGLTLIETWRGPRFRALVLEADLLPSVGMPDAAGLAGTIDNLPGAGRVAALWLAAPGTGPRGGRLVVAVTETARPGDAR